MPTATTTTLKAKTPKGKKVSEQRLNQARRAAILLKHASDATRLLVLVILSEGEKHVGALCDELGLGQPAVSHHLALLRHGGIIAPERRGQNTVYSLTETGEELAEIVKGVMA